MQKKSAKAFKEKMVKELQSYSFNLIIKVLYSCDPEIPVTPDFAILRELGEIRGGGGEGRAERRTNPQTEGGWSTELAGREGGMETREREKGGEGGNGDAAAAAVAVASRARSPLSLSHLCTLYGLQQQQTTTPKCSTA